MAVETKELRRKLNTLKREVGTPAQRKALRAGARPIVKDAKRRTPQRYKKNIKTDAPRRTQGSGAPVVLNIGWERKAFVLRFFEQGAKPHEIRPNLKRTGRRGRAKRIAGALSGRSTRSRPILRSRETGDFLGVKVQHPGMRPRPILKTAFAAKQDEAKRLARESYRQSIQKAAQSG